MDVGCGLPTLTLLHNFKFTTQPGQVLADFGFQPDAFAELRPILSSNASVSCSCVTSLNRIICAIQVCTAELLFEQQVNPKSNIANGKKRFLLDQYSLTSIMLGRITGRRIGTAAHPIRQQDPAYRKWTALIRQKPEACMRQECGLDELNGGHDCSLSNT